MSTTEMARHGALQSLAQRVRGVRRPPAWTGVLALVAIFTWPANVYPPPVSNNIDISWITALHVAAHEGLRFGAEFNFVYGPLGYTAFPNLFYDDTGLVATVVTATIYLTAVGLVARATCGAYGLVLGGLTTLLVARLALGPIDRVELLPGILAAFAVVALHRANGPLSPRVGAALGVFAAYCELTKFSAGTLALAVVGVLALVPLLDGELPWRERVSHAWPPLAGAAGGLIALWLLAGETLWDLGPYLRNSSDFVFGNVDAVSVSAPGLDDHYVWAAIVAATLAVAVAVDGRGLRIAPRVGLALIWFGLTYVSFRHGFTRHDAGHVLAFFAPLLLTAAATFPLTSTRWVALIASLPLVAGIWFTGNHTVVGVLSVNNGAAIQQFDLGAPSGKRHAMQASIKRQLRQSYAFPPVFVERLRGQTVHFDPHEAAIAWAYPEFDWAPAPVFQSYSAYTAHLDDLNAEFLAGDDAPRYVLRENVVLDGRNSRFESPAYQLELICRYRQVLRNDRWQLLERGPTRCGAPQPARERRVDFGERVPAPPARGGIVTASFDDFDMPLEDRLRRMLLKRRTQWIWLGDGLVNRFLPGHAANRHVLTVPSCLGWSGELFDARAYREVALGWLPGVETGAIQDASYGVRFERVPFDCDGGRPGAAGRGATR